jgi:hypothetical protein
LVALLRISSQLGCELWSGGDEAGLAKFAVAYKQYTVRKLDIA